MSRLARYETVIWDWNGTLLDDVQLCLEIANELLEERGIPALTPERYRSIFDFPVRLYYERAGLQLDDAGFRALSGLFCARFEQRLERAPLFGSAARLLGELRDLGSRQCVLSNTEQQSLERMLARYGISNHFALVQGRPDTLALGKLEAGKALLARGSIDTGRTLLVGDTLHDAEVAQELGVDCVLVAAGHQSAQRLAAADCSVVESLELLAAQL